MQNVELVKDRIDIVDVVGETVELRPSGTNYLGFCPFHHNTHTPAFAVFTNSQTWKCFSCDEGGDVISFVMRAKNCNFREALIILAERAGITLPNRSQTDETQILRQILTETADYYHELLLSDKRAKEARSYLRNRGLTGDTVRKFKLGYAIDGWHDLQTHLAEKFSLSDLVDAGVLSFQNGRHYDRFRQRIIFPLFSKNNKIVGLAGRVIDDTLPKYLNTPDSALFTKGDHLYGLEHINPREEEIVVVEGYMDVIQGHQHGFTNLVAQMGTALTPRQLELLHASNSRRSIVVATDGDKPGIKSALKNAPNLIQCGQAHKLDMRIAILPPDKDPDDVIRSNPSMWADLISWSNPLLEKVIELLASQYNLSKVEEKVALTEDVIPLLALLKNPVEQAHYRQMLADILSVQVSDIELPAATSKNNGADPPVNAKRKNNSTKRTSQQYAQERFLYYCLKNPLLFFQINELFSAANIPPIQPQEFIQHTDQLIVQEVLMSGGSFDSDLLPEVARRQEELLHLPMPNITDEEKSNLLIALGKSVTAWRVSFARSLMTQAHLLNESEILAQSALSMQNAMQQQQKFNTHSNKLVF